MRILVTLLLILSLFGIANAQVINAGIGGNSTKDLLARIDKDVLSENPDLTIVMVGTNDMLNSRKMLTYQEYLDNLNAIVKTLTNAGSNVLLMSSPPADSTYLFMRHDRKLYTEAPNEKMDSVRKIVSRIAKEKQVYFIDIFQKFQDLGLPKHNEDLFIMNPKNSGYRDGVHPTRLGYLFIAENVFEFLNKNNLFKKGDKVICFGDSITKGSKVKGSGTSEGETYPANLQNLIVNYLTYEQ